jgi:hypothetical protein
MTKKIPLSLSGPADKFAQAVQAHIEACTKHQMSKGANPGERGTPAPRASDVIESVIARVPLDGPVATRGPDRFVALPYEIIDDTPKTPEQKKTIETLRATIK